MIIVKMMGGLGNQMFQWALGRTLALKNSSEFKIDVYFLIERQPRKNFTIRTYDLDIFNLNAEFATKNEIAKYPIPMFGKFGVILVHLKQMWRRRINTNGYNYLIQTRFDYDEQIDNAPVNSYLEGYFQTERYFKPYEDIIRKDFEFRDQLSGKTFEMSQLIKEKQSVAVHIRRGDYVSNAKANKTHGVLGKEYYDKAMETIASKVESPHYFIFSDDNEWCRDNFAFGENMTIIEDDIKGNKFQFSLNLMSQCKHAIIANSSFSWWGAWLSTNPDKIVIGPQNWFRNPNLNTKDIMPESWLKI
ncbi:MAG: alpha-1,2-fucosyltransferase [Ignavibacteriae bacterium HGW-Ignavibacteriae-1]|nr:MAG: alpha-1,2-fucosyltransferase [Ignavibacteriae bacterium HGW-Ignavibacteriae-1]